VQFRLAEMATKVEAAHQMVVMAARCKDSGARNDLEAGMAKYLASEYCKEVVEDSFRIHGGYGYSTEYEIERLNREAPMLLIGEGTADIQKMIIGRRLLEGTGSEPVGGEPRFTPNRPARGSVEAGCPGRVTGRLRRACRARP
jgi:alkylation response protein AidB-like acyl-CoA dehydrogenase